MVYYTNKEYVLQTYLRDGETKGPTFEFGEEGRRMVKAGGATGRR